MFVDFIIEYQYRRAASSFRELGKKNYLVIQNLQNLNVYNMWSNVFILGIKIDIPSHFALFQ